jgi:hypothetical protein
MSADMLVAVIAGNGESESAFEFVVDVHLKTQVKLAKPLMREIRVATHK